MQAISNYLKTVVSKPAVFSTATRDGVESTSKEGVPKGDNLVPPVTESLPEEQETTASDLIIIRETVYDLIKDIQDPEKPETLEELNVVSEDNVLIKQFSDEKILVRITFVPTVPHCSLASLIGLCLRKKITDCLPEKHKLDIFVKEGSHETADDINKQINDKERIAAAMENPNLRDLVNKCIDTEGGYR